MKRTGLRVHLVAAVAAACCAGAASAALTPGSLAFVGLNADGNDDIALVALQPISVGEVINFTDNEWNGTGWIDASENAYELTITSAVPAGAIVTITNVSGVQATPVTATSNFGTLLPIPGSGTNAGIGNSDEAVWVFSGPYATPTSFATVMGNDVIANTGNVLTGTGLTEGDTAFFLPGDEDIEAYTGARSGQASFVAFRPLIYTAGSWISQDAGGDQSIDTTPPDVPFDSTAFTVVPEPGALFWAALGALVVTFRTRCR